MRCGVRWFGQGRRVAQPHPPPPPPPQRPVQPPPNLTPVERAPLATHPPPPPPPVSRYSPRRNLTNFQGDSSTVGATPKAPPTPPTPPQYLHQHSQPSSPKSPSSSNPMDLWSTKLHNIFQTIKGRMAWNQLQAAFQSMTGAARERAQQPKGNASHGAKMFWDAVPVVLLWGLCALWPGRSSGSSGVKPPTVSGRELPAGVSQECNQTSSRPVASGDIIVSDAWVLLGPVNTMCFHDPGDHDLPQGPVNS
mmetsp:Transcript_53451/g.106375  ORF Transcript_53451/g.106375 Transcript_53451/m.106375 type:complete len:250 (+) Transcript_53451:37-786(+)